MSCQLLFIEVLTYFCQFSDLFVIFSKLEIIEYGLGVFFGCSREVLIWVLGMFFEILGRFDGPLVKSHFFQLVAFRSGFHFLNFVVLSVFP
jgi:uncharacterized membrane protein required for colicin V production